VNISKILLILQKLIVEYTDSQIIAFMNCSIKFLSLQVDNFF